MKRIWLTRSNYLLLLEELPRVKVTVLYLFRTLLSKSLRRSLDLCCLLLRFSRRSIFRLIKDRTSFDSFGVLGFLAFSLATGEAVDLELSIVLLQTLWICWANWAYLAKVSKLSGNEARCCNRFIQMVTSTLDASSGRWSSGQVMSLSLTVEVAVSEAVLVSKLMRKDMDR